MSRPASIHLWCCTVTEANRSLLTPATVAAQDGAALAATVQARWADHVAQHNRRNALAAALLTMGLDIGFVALDRLLVSDARSLLILLVDRAVMFAAAGLLFVVQRGPRFARFSSVITAVYMAVLSLCLAVMTTQLGGFASSYYAGINLVTLAAGLLFLWPLGVAATTHALAVVGYIALNLASDPDPSLQTGLTHVFFLASSGLIVTVGQRLTWQAQHTQVAQQVMVEATKARLERAHEELQKLDAFKSAFFANITHELKTPLAMVLSPLELMLQGDLGPVAEAQKLTLRSMLRSGLKLLSLIDDLLDLARLEQAGLKLRIAERDLVPWLAELVEQVRVLAARKNIDLSWETETDSCIVWVDLDRLERVVVNLLSNALKFTEPDGKVAVRLRLDGDKVRVTVTDTGPGFPPELAERLFERFFQVDMADTRKHGGTGIGLALARQLVELHGGSLQAQGELGKGATFTLSLCLGRDHLPMELLVKPGEQLIPGTARQNRLQLLLHGVHVEGKQDYKLLTVAEAAERRVVERDRDEHLRRYTVLIVDDTPDVIRVMHLALRQEFKVLAAPDGLKGLELALKERPSLIITDLMMPGIDGFELVRRLRQEASTRHIPIIMVTARGEVDDRVMGLESGVNSYLTKPFSPRELLATARKLLLGSEEQADLLLNQRMDSIESLAGGVAHEINNPINYIHNSVLRLAMDVASLFRTVVAADGRALTDSERQELDDLRLRTEQMIHTAQAGVTRIQGTVEVLGRYSREGYTRAPREHDLWQAIRDIAAVVIPATGRSVAVSFDLTGNGVLECVPDELHQALGNLIQNAAEAAPQQGGRLVIEGHQTVSGLEVSVTDNGQGIAQDDRQRIFEPFFSTKGPGRGMGMGLTITRRVIAAAGGEIALETPPGGGVRFVVRLPRRAPVQA